MIHEVYNAGKTYIFAERNGHSKLIESQTRGASEYRQTMYDLKALFTRSLNEPISLFMCYIMLRHLCKMHWTALHRALNESCVMYVISHKRDLEKSLKMLLMLWTFFLLMNKLSFHERVL